MATNCIEGKIMNGDTIDVVEAFLSDENGELPSEISKRDRILLIAIRSVRTEMKTIVKPVADMAKDTSDIVRGEKKRNEEGSLVYKVERNERVVRIITWAFGLFATTFVTTIGALLASGLLQAPTP
jgi:hypothetical protein